MNADLTNLPLEARTVTCHSTIRVTLITARSPTFTALKRADARRCLTGRLSATNDGLMVVVAVPGLIIAPVKRILSRIYWEKLLRLYQRERYQIVPPASVSHQLLYPGLKQAQSGLVCPGIRTLHPLT